MTDYVITKEQIESLKYSESILDTEYHDKIIAAVMEHPLEEEIEKSKAYYVPTSHPTIHFVKCWTPYFQAMKRGDKKFDKRVWDRDYRVGDTLIQEEWNPDTGYTGDSIGHIIKYILEGEFAEPGVCLMSVDGVEFKPTKCLDETTGYIIKEDEITEAIRLFRLYGICPSTINVLESNVRSRPLSEEVKKARREAFDEILKGIEKLSCQYGAADFWSNETIGEITKLIQSLRGEQP